VRHVPQTPDTCSIHIQARLDKAVAPQLSGGRACLHQAGHILPGQLDVGLRDVTTPLGDEDLDSTLVMVSRTKQVRRSATTVVA